MSRSDRPLIGSVYERKTSAFSEVNRPKPSGSSRTGFPVVQHRSKSAFARGRDEFKRSGSGGPNRTKDIPVVRSVNDTGGRTGGLTPRPVIDTDDLRRQISEENEKKLEAMTEEERNQERREIIEHFGVGIGDLLQKARETRERRLAREEGNDASMTDAIQMMDTDTHFERDKSDSSSDGMFLTSLDVFLIHPFPAAANTSPQPEDKIFTRSRGRFSVCNLAPNY